MCGYISAIQGNDKLVRNIQAVSECGDRTNRECQVTRQREPKARLIKSALTPPICLQKSSRFGDENGRIKAAYLSGAPKNATKMLTSPTRRKYHIYHIDRIDQIDQIAQIAQIDANVPISYICCAGSEQYRSNPGSMP